MPRTLKIGDRIEVINYGCMRTKNDDIEIQTEDIKPELVGKIGILCKIEFGKFYATGIPHPLNKDQVKWLPPLEVENLLSFLDEQKIEANEAKVKGINFIKTKVVELWKIE